MKRKDYARFWVNALSWWFIKDYKVGTILSRVSRAPRRIYVEGEAVQIIGCGYFVLSSVLDN